MIVIGTDAHKGSHALAAVDNGTGQVRGQREVKADEAGHLAAMRWARELDNERVWAIARFPRPGSALAQAARLHAERAKGGAFDLMRISSHA
jgi:hypothetical protein